MNGGPRSSSQANNGAETRFTAMNTDVHVLLCGGTPNDMDRAKAMVEDYEARWSRFLPTSEVSAINQNPTTPMVVSADTFALIAEAIDAHSLTAGAFDPTIHDTMVAAGYDVTFDEIDELRPASHVPAPSPDSIELHHTVGAVVVPRGVAIDLGGIAKGAAADAIAEAMIGSGISGALVNIGGDLRVAGRGPQPNGWSVTLDCPGSPERRTVVLAEGAVCTSTTTKRRWRSTQGFEHHLRNPSSGSPLDTGLITATILSARARQAEVLAKAVLTAGLEGAAKVALAHDATGVVVTSDGVVHELPGFENFTEQAGLAVTS